MEELKQQLRRQQKLLDEQRAQAQQV